MQNINKLGQWHHRTTTSPCFSAASGLSRSTHRCRRRITRRSSRRPIRYAACPRLSLVASSPNRVHGTFGEMNKSVYIESSVISYPTAWPSRDLVIAGHRAVAVEWWNEHRLRYDVYVSPLVVEEISAGDASAAEERLRVIADILSVTIAAEAESLASALLAANAVPANSARDALHVAIAATQGTDYLITWNFRHINNASTRTMVVHVVSDFGLACPVLCSPEELMGEGDA